MSRTVFGWRLSVCVLEHSRKIARVADPHTGRDLLNGKKAVFEHLPGSFQFNLPDVLPGREAERGLEQMAEAGGRQADLGSDFFNRDIAMRVVMNVLAGRLHPIGSQLSIERRAMPFGVIRMRIQCDWLVQPSAHERLSEKAIALPQQTQ